MEGPGKCNLLTAMENIAVGEDLAACVTLVFDKRREPWMAIGRVFGATGTELYRVELNTMGSYRGAVLAVLDELRKQWETNQTL